MKISKICLVFGSIFLSLITATLLFTALLVVPPLVPTLQPNQVQAALLEVCDSDPLVSYAFILELEGQVVNHTGDDDSFKEFVVASNARLHKLPWKRIKVTIASGIGLSLAITVPDRERKNHSNANQLLCYLMYEATFSLPKYERWSLVPRMHHRSGVFGLFDGVHGGSNYPSLGIKYNF